MTTGDASLMLADSPPGRRRWSKEHQILALVARRCALGFITLVVVSAVIFLATEILPGNAAEAVLGHSATPARVRALEIQLHLNRSVPGQYWAWLSGLLRGRLGTSLADGQPVWSLVGPRLGNSVALVVVAGIISTVLGTLLGAVVALRKSGWVDHLTSTITLTVAALPEFVVAVGLVILLSTVVWHFLPAVSLITPGQSAWAQPRLLILPVCTLVVVTVPYLFRMVRGTMLEALESEYVEMARLSGVSEWRVVCIHALPNAIAPAIQVVGLNFLYLAGGIVIVEDVFDYPGIGQGLINAVADRDIPVIQLIVIMLAAFYVFMNILTDVIALLASPRRRAGR